MGERICWRVEDCEGTVGFSFDEHPTCQLSFTYDEDYPAHVINLDADEVNRLIDVLNLVSMRMADRNQTAIRAGMGTVS